MQTSSIGENADFGPSAGHDLRERVWTHYGWAIQNLLREQRVTYEPLDDYDQDLPF